MHADVLQVEAGRQIFSQRIVVLTGYNKARAEWQLKVLRPRMMGNAGGNSSWSDIHAGHWWGYNAGS